MAFKYYVECVATGKIFGYAYTEQGANKLAERFVANKESKAIYVKKCEELYND